MARLIRSNGGEECDRSAGVRMVGSGPKTVAALKRAVRVMKARAGDLDVFDEYGEKVERLCLRVDEWGLPPEDGIHVLARIIDLRLPDSLGKPEVLRVVLEEVMRAFVWSVFGHLGHRALWALRGGPPGKRPVARLVVTALDDRGGRLYFDRDGFTIDSLRAAMVSCARAFGYHGTGSRPADREAPGLAGGAHVRLRPKWRPTFTGEMHPVHIAPLWQVTFGAEADSRLRAYAAREGDGKRKRLEIGATEPVDVLNEYCSKAFADPYGALISLAYMLRHGAKGAKPRIGWLFANLPELFGDLKEGRQVKGGTAVARVAARLDPGSMIRKRTLRVPRDWQARLAAEEERLRVRRERTHLRGVAHTVERLAAERRGRPFHEDDWLADRLEDIAAKIRRRADGTEPAGPPSPASPWWRRFRRSE